MSREKEPQEPSLNPLLIVGAVVVAATVFAVMDFIVTYAKPDIPEDNWAEWRFATPAEIEAEMQRQAAIDTSEGYRKAAVLQKMLQNRHAA
jgi:hypothetical protein